MTVSADLHSPKQISQALGVSESSLKRWCDQGLIRTVRTAGGHRKLPTDDVLRFARDRGMALVSPEILGLPPASVLLDTDLRKSVLLLAEALLKGSEPLTRQIVMYLHLAGHSAARIFDEVIAGAFHEIGDRWACRQADVYQERRACEIMIRVLSEIRKTQLPPDGKLEACGGTAEGDPYVLPTTMAELVLRECGFQATNLGASIPFSSMSRAVRELRPVLFWLSVSHVSDEREFLTGFSELSSTCEKTGTVLVVGGQALSPPMREKLVDCSPCETMQQLASFAGSLARVCRRSLPDGGTT